mmetsp:Transcript_3687/g.10405  ORF Transcript_3687/g.10405 Transcript_3687/m.10405 type:complete len:296 (+) Transcript_3687:284-1171(+)
MSLLSASHLAESISMQSRPLAVVAIARPGSHELGKAAIRGRPTAQARTRPIVEHSLALGRLVLRQREIHFAPQLRHARCVARSHHVGKRHRHAIAANECLTLEWALAIATEDRKRQPCRVLVVQQVDDVAAPARHLLHLEEEGVGAARSMVEPHVSHDVAAGAEHSLLSAQKPVCRRALALGHQLAVGIGYSLAVLGRANAHAGCEHERAASIPHVPRSRGNIGNVVFASRWRCSKCDVGELASWQRCPNNRLKAQRPKPVMVVGAVGEAHHCCARMCILPQLSEVAAQHARAYH